MVHIQISAKLFTDKLLKGLERRVYEFREHALRGCADGNEQALRTPEEWLEAYRAFSKGGHDIELNDLIKAFLADS